ncbi:hypothetical protein E2542_SST15896 [Spatholobus suberectus]|nr:hypothetical protein E2542_SST15896 [Spatholobus suberectus]
MWDGTTRREPKPATLRGFRGKREKPNRLGRTRGRWNRGEGDSESEKGAQLKSGRWGWLVLSFSGTLGGQMSPISGFETTCLAGVALFGDFDPVRLGLR